MKTGTKLRVVAADAAAASPPPAPETALTILFAAEAVLLQQLADVRRQLADVRGAYCRANALIVPPAIDRLRVRYGPRAEGRA